jgi:prostaglandin-endoperoxide synthase 2
MRAGDLGGHKMQIPPVVNRLLPGVMGALRHLPFGRRLVTHVAVHVLANATPPRPRPFSLASDYTSWLSLTDRTFTGRHLPVADPGELPTEAEVKELFRRKPGGGISSNDSSVLFMFFAQWFTDSFLRTDRQDWRKNTSTQEIDFCQIYGLTERKTRLLREMSGGRLKSQQIDGEEYPPFLFERTPGGSHAVRPEFDGLHDEEFLMKVLLRDVSERQKDLFFAVGLEHGNSTVGSTALDVVFLREHNRVAAILEQEYNLGRERPKWGRPLDPAELDERLFQTTRSVMVVLLLKLVVEEYIRHIAPYDLPLELIPGLADGKSWNRSNWIAIEFNLLYRWHSMIPDKITTDDGEFDAKEFSRNNNDLLLAKGVEWFIAQCSRSRAARVGLFNTPAFLLDRNDAADYPAVEERTISLMRAAQLRSYNDYRRRFGLAPAKDFAQVTKDVAVQQRLKQLYKHVDRLEWYVGIFAEDYPDEQFLGELMTTMVGYDAFTQALTNPLLSRNVFNEETFSAAGMTIIQETKSLQQILARNAKSPGAAFASFEC